MAATVDVRDMQCSQALAQAAQAMARLSPGESLEAICNAEDVRADLVAWARELGHAVLAMQVRGNEWTVTLRKG